MPQVAISSQHVLIGGIMERPSAGSADFYSFSFVFSSPFLSWKCFFFSLGAMFLRALGSCIILYLSSCIDLGWILGFLLLLPLPLLQSCGVEKERRYEKIKKRRIDLVFSFLDSDRQATETQQRLNRTETGIGSCHFEFIIDFSGYTCYCYLSIHGFSFV
ncbi:hypothetical protein BJX63DRAFT_46124 [Aspergillus granulosus]|uniref:Uncharacterized protein n=1 Tax=Aspergillus granulosus TaxID=176169 RepID=A0ABR4HTR4_9EURO